MYYSHLETYSVSNSILVNILCLQGDVLCHRECRYCISICVCLHIYICICTYIYIHMGQMESRYWSAGIMCSTVGPLLTLKNTFVCIFFFFVFCALFVYGHGGHMERRSILIGFYNVLHSGSFASLRNIWRATDVIHQQYLPKHENSICICVIYHIKNTKSHKRSWEERP